MSTPTPKAIPQGMHTITPHIVVRDAARAAPWCKPALGAEERSRLHGIAQRLRDEPPDDVARAAAASFGS